MEGKLIFRKASETIRWLDLTDPDPGYLTTDLCRCVYKSRCTGSNRNSDRWDVGAITNLHFSVFAFKLAVQLLKTNLPH